LKKNSLDLNDVNPECIEIRDEIVRIQKKIDELKPKYDEYNNKLMLNKEEATDKADIGHELYGLNIKAIGKINELALCQEGRRPEYI
jgi:uncharacterized protein YlxW (UPF0749 family)